jgi:hypothetical protein
MEVLVRRPIFVALLLIGSVAGTGIELHARPAHRDDIIEVYSRSGGSYGPFDNIELYHYVGTDCVGFPEFYYAEIFGTDGFYDLSYSSQGYSYDSPMAYYDGGIEYSIDADWDPCNSEEYDPGEGDTVYPEAEYVDHMVHGTDSDQTSSLPSSYCPICTAYNGKLLIVSPYTLIDQWGSQMVNSSYVSETLDSNFASCTPTGSSPAGAPFTGVAYDYHALCWDDCNAHTCYEQIYQSIYADDYHMLDTYIDKYCDMIYITIV